MAASRTKNRFGKRYIRLQEFRDYAVDLDLTRHPISETLLEFFEENGLLAPVRRIQMPPAIVRRLHQMRYPEDNVVAPVEPDGPLLDAAIALMDTINTNRWANASIYGECVHVLDAPESTHAKFIRTEFPPESFQRWDTHRVKICGPPHPTLYSSNQQYAPSFFHYWQIFWFAALLRSGLRVFYPLGNSALESQLFSGSFSTDALGARTYHSFNLEASGELDALRRFEPHFEIVGYFSAYTHNALQCFAKDRDSYGRISQRHWKQYLKREREIAREILDRSDLNDTDIISFIRKQCDWWNNALHVGPTKVAEEYKRNIRSSIMLLRAATDVDATDVITRVGYRTGHNEPTLKVIFTDWVEEQRDLAIRSLKNWIDPELSLLPAPFQCVEADLHEFCDWLEDRDLFQYYWHFRRLLDLNRRDDPVHRAVSTSEVVGFATLCELICNEVMLERGLSPRGSTLSSKLRHIFGVHGPIDLSPYFKRYRKLVNTATQSMPQRLAQISRVRAGGQHAPILRAMLAFMVIRNEGVHLGLLRFAHPAVIELIRKLAIASLLVWKSR